MSTAWREHVHGSIKPLEQKVSRDWFDWACAAVCVAITALTIAFIWSVS